MPITELRNTSFAAAKASINVAFFGRTFWICWLGIIIIESTYCERSLIPNSANCIRFLPSKLNGLVTTATVRIPNSFATLATIGAAPVPVPPPIPAAIKTMSAPSSILRISSWSSSAALRPTFGFAPAPRPFVVAPPICTVC